MKLAELKVNHFTTPLGFQITLLSFSWKVTDSESKKAGVGKALYLLWRRYCI